VQGALYCGISGENVADLISVGFDQRESNCLVPADLVTNAPTTGKLAQCGVKSLNAFDWFPYGPYRDIVCFNSRHTRCGRLGDRSRRYVGCRIVLARQIRRFKNILKSAIRPHQNEISDDHRRVSDVQVCALAYCLFHPVRQIPKCLRDTFTGNRQYRSDPVLGYHDIHVFCF
jgi:hypothetical protein